LAAMLVVLAGVIYKNKEAIEEWWNFNKGVDIDQFLAEIVGWITQVDTLATSYGNLKQKIKELYDWLPSLPSISDLLPEWFGGFRRGLRERGAPEQIFGMTTEIAQPRGGLLAGGIQRTNNMDVTFNIMSQTGDPNSIAAEVTNRLGEYLRSTAAEMGQ